MRKAKYYLGLCAVFMLVASLLLAGCAKTAPAPTPAPASTLTPAPVEETWTLNCQAFSGVGTEFYTVAEHIVENIDKMSHGRIKINMIAPGGICSTAEMFDALSAGALDCGTTYGGMYGGTLPVANLHYALPGDPRSLLELGNFYHERGADEFMREVHAKFNVFYTASLLYPGYTAMSTKPVASLDDWRNLKTRAIGMTAEMLTNAGIPTCYIPYAEIYMGLATGTIDASVNSCPVGYKSTKVYEVAKYSIIPPITACMEGNLSFNMDVWKEFPAYLQDIILVATEAGSYELGRLLEGSWAESVAFMRDQGVIECVLPDADMEELRAVAYELWDEKAQTDADCMKYIQMVRDNLKTLGYD